MFKGLYLAGASAALAMACAAATPSLADFSACASAYQAQDLHQKIDLYTICLKHGGLMAASWRPTWPGRSTTAG